MSGTCTLGTYQYDPINYGFGEARCTCANCTEREAKVLAETNAKRKALLALDQAMKDLAAPCVQPSDHMWERLEVAHGRIANATDAWQAARRFVMGGGA